MHPRWAAINERIKKAATFEKATSKASMSTDGASTVSTVLWESQADVDDWAGSNDNGKVDAAGGAAAMVGSMQVMEEVIEAPISERPQAVELCRRMEGCGNSWSRSWSVRGRSRPSRCYRGKNIPGRGLEVRAMRDLQRDL